MHSYASPFALVPKSNVHCCLIIIKLHTVRRYLIPRLNTQTSVTKNCRYPRTMQGRACTLFFCQGLIYPFYRVFLGPYTRTRPHGLPAPAPLLEISLQHHHSTRFFEHHDGVIVGPFDSPNIMDAIKSPTPIKYKSPESTSNRCQ